MGFHAPQQSDILRLSLSPTWANLRDKSKVAMKAKRRSLQPPSSCLHVCVPNMWDITWGTSPVREGRQDKTKFESKSSIVQQTHSRVLFFDELSLSLSLSLPLPTSSPPPSCRDSPFRTWPRRSLSWRRTTYEERSVALMLKAQLQQAHEAQDGGQQ